MKWLKIILLSGSFLTIILVSSWSVIQEKLDYSSLQNILNVIQNGAQTITYKGTDAAGRIYSVRAKSIEVLSDCEYLLKDVILDIVMPNKKEIVIKSDQVLYQKTLKIANLKGNVDLKTQDGFMLKTNTARVYVEKSYAEGDEYVECTKGDAFIKAIGFKMDDLSGNVKFKGRPTLIKQK